QFPIELLRQFQPHRLLPFNAIRLLESRDIEPAFLRLALADDAAAIRDEAIDQKCFRSSEEAFLLVDAGGVVGHEDEGLQAGARGVGRHSPARVSRGGTSDALHSKLFSLGNGQGHTARLETSGGQTALVLNPKMRDAEMRAEPISLEQ